MQFQGVGRGHLRAEHERLFGFQEFGFRLRGRLPGQQQQRRRQQHQAAPDQGARRADGMNRAPARTDDTGKLQHYSLLVCLMAVCSRTQSR
ncbi:hypothetical protein D3C73_1071310 [compost metagenome]